MRIQNFENRLRSILADKQNPDHQTVYLAFVCVSDYWQAEDYLHNTNISRIFSEIYSTYEDSTQAPEKTDFGIDAGTLLRYRRRFLQSLLYCADTIESQFSERFAASI